MIISAQTCRACGHAEASEQFKGNYECHEGPPMTQLLVAPTPKGPVVQGFITSPAIVGPDMRCARWKRRIAVSCEIAPVPVVAVSRG